MKLFLLHRCPYAHRATIVLQEKGLAFDTVFFSPGRRPPEQEAVGPYAKSPTLIDGDTSVWDAQVVIEYLEDRYPERSLLSKDARERATFRMLAARVEKELMTHAGAMMMENFKPQPDPQRIDEAKRRFIDALEAWDRQLEGRTFLVGNGLTLADVTLYTVFPAVGHGGLDIPADRRHLRAWYDRMSARPSCKLLEPGGRAPGAGSQAP